MSKIFNMNLTKYEKNADIFRALSHPIRLLVVYTLINKGPLNVSKLWSLLELSQSEVSQHLFKLKSFKVVSYERKGREKYYRVDDPTVTRVIKTLEL
ncbi:transcriptional regulator [Bacillus thuringiensis serovar yunnanensis]|nr:transcriptional regulator [Bacillus thuringiensis serovar yunnanensis]